MSYTKMDNMNSLSKIQLLAKVLVHIKVCLLILTHDLQFPSVFTLLFLAPQDFSQSANGYLAVNMCIK